MRVQDLRLREILATNSFRTIEVELETEKGSVRASVPIGTSRSKYEVEYLPVDEIVQNFSRIKRHFVSQHFDNQQDVDIFLRILDKTTAFRQIGGNLVLAISSAFLKAFAMLEDKEVFEYLTDSPTTPLPICNVAGGWKGQSDIQEFLLLPKSQISFLDSVKRIAKVYWLLGKKFKEADRNFNFGKNLESAWSTSLQFEKVLEILSDSVWGEPLGIGLDVAASQLWSEKNQKYVYRYCSMNMLEQLNVMEKILKEYPITYMEDPFHEDDFITFSNLAGRVKDKLIVGDDLFSTNLERLQYGISYRSANGIIIKPSQAGTITDVINIAEEAKKNGIKTIISHRSGETEDNLISHLAAGLNSDYIKLGITGERIVKINEMIRIEEKINNS